MDTDRPTALIWKISNGDISATGHLIHFMFGSGVGFWGLMDRMALFPLRSNPRWSVFEYSNGMSYTIHFHEIL